MDRETWLQQRRTFLGASEVAAVCGLDPFRSPLDVWASKKGLIADSRSVAADLGNLFEAPLLNYYAARNGRTLTQPGTLQRPDHPWMAATPDAIADGQRNVQVKVVGRHMVQLWGAEPPDYVQAQVQWEMWVAGLAITDVVACLGGTDYQEFAVARHDGAIGYLVELCSRFWTDYVVADRMPEIDGSDSARAILAALYPNPTAGMGDAPAEVVQMARAYRELGQQTAALEAQRDLIGNRLRQAIGDSDGLKWPGGYVSWKKTSAGQRVLRVQIKE